MWECWSSSVVQMSSTIGRSPSSSSSSDNEGKGSRFGLEMPDACAKVTCTLNGFAGGNPSMPASRYDFCWICLLICPNVLSAPWIGVNGTRSRGHGDKSLACFLFCCFDLQCCNFYEPPASFSITSHGPVWAYCVFPTRPFFLSDLTERRAKTWSPI
jgi:hypothetical protein